MKSEYPIEDLNDIGDMLAWLAKRLKISIYALSSLSGSVNSSLQGFASGSKRSGDLNAGPLFRVLTEAGYELVSSPLEDKGIVLSRPGADDLMVVGLDGGRIEITWDSVADIGKLLNTMAMARGVTVTGLIKESGINSTSLVSLAMGNSTNKDVRLNGVLRVVKIAGFATRCRPVHATRAEARRAFAGLYRG